MTNPDDQQFIVYTEWNDILDPLYKWPKAHWHIQNKEEKTKPDITNVREDILRQKNFQELVWQCLYRSGWFWNCMQNIKLTKKKDVKNTERFEMQNH